MNDPHSQGEYFHQEPPPASDPDTPQVSRPATPQPPAPPAYEQRHYDLANRIVIDSLVQSKGVDAGPALRRRIAEELNHVEVTTAHLAVRSVMMGKALRRWWEFWK